MNNLDEIKKRLAYVKSNNLFDAHYINDMNWLIEINKAHLTTCSTLMKMAELKEQALINVSVGISKYMELTFHPDEVEYKKLKVLIEDLMSIPGMELPEKETLFSQAQKFSDHIRQLSTE